jgi:hypothetical protein
MGFGEGETDYDRACAVRDYAGLVVVGDGYGLVLGDEPLATTWVEATTNRPGNLVCWLYSEDESSILGQAEQVPESAFPPTGLDFAVTCSRHFLFDAALCGVSMRMGDFLELALHPGRYSVQTAVYEPDKRTGLIVHRFVIQ